MSIRFKFRSSPNFDSVYIEGRPSISVRELRSKIVCHNNLNFCQDLDLVFSDALTGREYNDENLQIPSGSSVIIKRVPAGTAPSAMVPIKSVENFGTRGSVLFNPIGYPSVSGQVDDFYDFGVDFCPVPEATFPDSDIEFGKKNCISNEKANIAGSRVGCQKLEASDLSEAIPIGSSHSGTEGKPPRVKLETKVEEHMNLEKMVSANSQAVQNADFPSELKCSLCDTFFKEAVMIPCCQHSFCEKCIRLVLSEKARCPKCCSSKCRAEDLLPNLSLRQAIEHFLESQILINGSDNALNKYAPDGESGIQAKDVSCAVTIGQRELDLPHSPSATEKGSNQVVAESLYKSLARKNAPIGGSWSHIRNSDAEKVLNSTPLSHKAKQIGERDGYARLAAFQGGPEDMAVIDDFQGENQPLNLPRTRVQEEADSAVRRKRGLWIQTGGGDRSFMATGRHKKGDRTCYMCGSPDHFIRDCPVASSPHPMYQIGNGMFPGGMQGYASPYWNGTGFSPIRPFSNMYGSPGMVPFNSSMVPVAPFAVPSYVPTMYGGLPAPGGFMRMGGLALPVGTSAERPLSHSEMLELRDFENRRKLSNDNLGRGQPYGDEDDDITEHYHYNEPEESDEYKSRMGRERSLSYSEDSFTRISQRKHWQDKHLHHDIHSVDERHERTSRSSIPRRDRRLQQQERSNSGVEDMPNSSDRHSEERHKHHNQSSKKHRERRGQGASDSSWCRQQSQKDKNVKRRGESDVKGSIHKHHSHTESGLEPSSSSGQKGRHRDKDSGHGSERSRCSTKPIGDEVCNDRWQMATGSDENCGEGYQYHKRKRVH